MAPFLIHCQAFTACTQVDIVEFVVLGGIIGAPSTTPEQLLQSPHEQHIGTFLLLLTQARLIILIRLVGSFSKILFILRQPGRQVRVLVRGVYEAGALICAEIGCCLGGQVVQLVHQGCLGTLGAVILEDGFGSDEEEYGCRDKQGKEHEHPYEVKEEEAVARILLLLPGLHGPIDATDPQDHEHSSSQVEPHKGIIDKLSSRIADNILLLHIGINGKREEAD